MIKLIEICIDIQKQKRERKRVPEDLCLPYLYNHDDR